MGCHFFQALSWARHFTISASLHPGVLMGTGEFNAWDNLPANGAPCSYADFTFTTCKLCLCLEQNQCNQAETKHEGLECLNQAGEVKRNADLPPLSR